MRHLRYQDLISDFIQTNPNATKVHSLASRSTFFYLSQPPGKPEYGRHLPLLRSTNRFRIEPLEVDGIGLSKSFHNTRTMVAAGHHLTRQTHAAGSQHVRFQFLPTDDILIHHYRNKCKYQKYCEAHWNETIFDDILSIKFGHKIQKHVEKVLGIIGYGFKS